MSWGNAQNAWNDQDMDSQGKKLSVNGSVGGATSNYRVHIEELQGANSALEVFGGTRMTNLSTQNVPILKVDGDTNLGGYRAEIIDASIQSKALKTDGSIHIWRGGAVRGRLTPGYDFPPYQGAFGINIGESPQSAPDPSIFIGQASPNGGNDTLIGSRRVMVGGGGSGAVTPDDTYLVQLNGPVRVAGLDGVAGDEVAIKTEGLIVSTGLKLPTGQNEIQIGKTNRTTGQPATAILIGEGAGETGANKRGSNVTIRGDVTIQAGTETNTPNPGDLTVARHVVCNGNLTANGFSFLQGNVDMSGNAGVHGNVSINGQLSLFSIVASPLTVGSLVTPQNTVLNGNLRVSGNVEMAGPVTTNLEVQGDLSVGSSAVVEGSASIGQEMKVQGESQFQSRSFHSEGVAVSGQGDPFYGMIKQNNRLEFFVNGTLRFYIDSTGGHNA